MTIYAARALSAVLFALVSAMMVLALTTEAHAYRPAHSGPASKHSFDVCKNVKGKQTYWDFIYGKWTPNYETRRKWDCKRKF